MSKKDTIESRTWDLLCPILDELGLKPVDVEYVKEAGEYYLRCYIDKEGGVGILDCEEVSRRIDPLLDSENYIEDAYTLEVSSPGLGRPLRRPHDFEFALGKEIEIRTYKAENGKKGFSGILKQWDKNSVTIAADESEEELTFERTAISLIRLALDL